MILERFLRGFFDSYGILPGDSLILKRFLIDSLILERLLRDSSRDSLKSREQWLMYLTWQTETVLAART